MVFSANNAVLYLKYCFLSLKFPMRLSFHGHVEYKALAAWCRQLGSIGSCMGGASYGAICLLLLAFAPFELIVHLPL
jgi:hypothetical protein